MDDNVNYVTSPKRSVRIVLEWVEEIVLALVLIAILFTFACRIVTVTGTSMVPSFHNGDRVLVVNTPTGVQQGDVVVIVNVLNEPIIKRVIATEGQTVDFDYTNKSVLVDGEPVDETQFGLENGITRNLSVLWDCWNFRKRSQKAAYLCWGTTAPFRKTAAIKMSV